MKSKKKRLTNSAPAVVPEQTWNWALKLAMLNEMSLGLSSSLDVGPLLQRILFSALELLEGQAGVLFLVDQQSGELVIETATSFLKEGLTARRFGPDACLAGRAAQNGLPVLANHIGESWQVVDPIFHAEAGMLVQHILAAPMRYQDRVIGVIEIVNKISGLPFDLSDQELLVTYTYQAATALENARLYSMTDQALTARVDELSVMQRIDRELNTSLEVETALQKTLAWAMRYSHAEAGLAGVVHDRGLDFVALGNIITIGADLSGFNTHELSFPFESYPDLRAAVDGGSQTGSGSGSISPLLMKKATHRIIVPLHRESTPIGFIILENSQADGFSQDTVEFLLRLCDHAAIALANARLYREIQEANLAKSKFVSFVAHELKNPMVSIKGYADILAGGMAGPVNEMQSGFLATIRANVDRMNTIISDLNDQTKIQAGNLRLEQKPVDLCEIIDDVVRSLSPQINEKGHQLSRLIPAENSFVWADPSRLTQILTNLISNAAKYTPSGGELVIGVAGFPAAGSDVKGNYLHIWVQDSGIGICSEDQAKIFQQYFRTTSAKEMASGTGLGLNITKSLVEMQGGQIWFESEPGKGTVFHFTLPVADKG